MLKLNGVGRLSLRWGPMGLALGTRQLHYAWVIVALASVMGMVSSSVRFALQALVPSLRYATRQASAGATAPSPWPSPCSGWSPDW